MTPAAARRQRLRPLLTERLEAARGEMGRLAGLIDLASAGRDPLHPPRLVPALRGRLSDAVRECRDIEARLAEFDEAEQFDWLFED